MIEHQRARKSDALANGTLQLVAQLDRAKRVDAGFHQWRVCVNSAACGTLDHLKHSFQGHHRTAATGAQPPTPCAWELPSEEPCS